MNERIRVALFSFMFGFVFSAIITLIVLIALGGQ